MHATQSVGNRVDGLLYDRRLAAIAQPDAQLEILRTRLDHPSQDLDDASGHQGRTFGVTEREVGDVFTVERVPR